MRHVAIALAALLVIAQAAPVAARQVPHRRECIKLTQQIARYERDLGWAEERDDVLWARTNVAQIERLEGRRDRLCPHLREPSVAQRVGRFLGGALALAAKAAKTAFTLGLL